MPVPHNSAFTGRMPFLPPKQQCPNTEGIEISYKPMIVYLTSKQMKAIQTERFISTRFVVSIEHQAMEDVENVAK